MKSQIVVCLLRSACSSRPPAARLHLYASVAIAALLAFLPWTQRSLRAQQPWQSTQGWGQNDPSNGQYPQQYQPSQQPSYSQQPDPGQPYPQQDYAQPQPQAQPLNTEQLEQLVAPIALYPDTLVAQVLAAATYPDQVVDADHWRQAQGYASPDQIAGGADAQRWDPSVKALTAFPQVLGEMDQNFRWTVALGNAYYNQPQDVLDVVQVMRQRAQAAGNLQSTPQEGMSYDQGYIQLAPPDPQTVYVPSYNPWTVYGDPVQPYRGFSLLSSLGSFLGSNPIQYGLGIAMSAFSRTNFGWLGWGLDWLTHSVLFHNSSYSSRSTSVADWGLPHGGPRAFPGRPYGQGGAIARQGDRGYRPQPGNYGRPGGALNGYEARNRPPAQGFVPQPERYRENRPLPEGNRFSPMPGNRESYGRPGLQAYNRSPEPLNRPQPYDRSGYDRPGYGYGSGFYGGNGNHYAPRPGPIYSAPQQSYRGFAPAPQRGNFYEEPKRSGKGFEGYGGKPPKSGGFHLFGGGHEPKGYGGGGHSSGHGHSDHGGHSGGGHSGGGHHR